MRLHIRASTPVILLYFILISIPSRRIPIQLMKFCSVLGLRVFHTGIIWKLPFVRFRHLIYLPVVCLPQKTKSLVGEILQLDADATTNWGYFVCGVFSSVYVSIFVWLNYDWFPLWYIHTSIGYCRHVLTWKGHICSIYGLALEVKRLNRNFYT